MTHTLAEKEVAELPARILVVDDDPSVRTSVTRWLRRQGHDVVCVESGEEALETIAAESRPFDLVISDVIMRGMSGVALAERLRAQDESLQLILISGYPGTHLRDSTLELDARDFIEKPFTPRQLTTRVREKIRRAAAPLSHHPDRVGA